ncbi:MAG TPA: hypothetical protein DCP92_10695 [Nitrospiraceae bacterium]|jgi:hypothetical protein|nr:hypothetical protein [Nitrospiraceae bacterium]
MATAFLYENDTDQKQHFRAVQMLARDLSMPEEEVKRLYETMLNCLKERARIKDYLVILASRCVKDVIKGREVPQDVTEAASSNICWMG